MLQYLAWILQSPREESEGLVYMSYVPKKDKSYEVLSETGVCLTLSTQPHSLESKAYEVLHEQTG